MQQLDGRVAVVTGAAGGIGAALAAALAAEGMAVAMYDIDGDAADAAAAPLRRDGARVVTYRVDVTDAAAVDAAVTSTVTDLGSVDVVCSNAGLMRPGAVWEQPPERWKQVVDVNLLGTVNLVCSVVPRMLASGRDGHIVTTVGVTAVFTSPFSPPGSYAVSKHALGAYTEILFQELRAIGAPIGVSCLSPSGVRSNIAADPDRVDGDTVRRPDIWPRVEALYRSIQAGHDPAEVAAQTVHAIKQDRFWILPDPADIQRVQHRANYIKAGTEPTAPKMGLNP